MRTIKHTYRIHAPVESVWKALVDPNFIEQWGGGPAVMSEDEGAKFKLWDGKIYGKNITVIPQKKLVQEWYGRKWENASVVIISLQKKNSDLTYVDLLHKYVPTSDLSDIAQAWLDEYLGPLKKFVEGDFR